MTEPPVHTGVEDVHAHAHKTGHRWVDLAIAVSAITISVISLVVAIEHGSTEERLVAANSWPFPFYVTNSDKAEDGSRLLTLRVQNGGVGPARVQSVVVRYAGQVVRSRAEFLKLCCGLPETGTADQVKAGLFSQNPVTGVLPARDGVTFLAWHERPGGEKVLEEVDRARTRLTFSACYCSVLDECWTSNLSPIGEPERVPRCRPTAEDYAG